MSRGSTRSPYSTPKAERRVLPIAALGLTLLAAGYLRLSNLQAAVVGDEIASGGPDAAYHARRMLATFQNYPHVPQFDPLLNWPAGAAAPWPPGFDFLVGTFALLAPDRFGALALISLMPVLLGLLIVVLVYVAGRKLEPQLHWSSAWLAATLFALFPQAVSVARFGNTDHHAAEALIMLGLGLWSVAVCRALASGALDLRARIVLETTGALIVAWAVPTFIGTSAYILIACISVGIANFAWGRGAPVNWAVGAPALAVGAALAMPIYAPLAAEHGLAFSYVYPSLLQPLLAFLGALGCAASTALGWATASRHRLRTLTAVLVVGVGAAALLVTSAHAAAAELVHGIHEWFFDKSSSLARISENQPLFSADSAEDSIVSRAHRYYGVLGPVMPLIIGCGLVAHVRRVGLHRGFPFVIWTLCISLLMLHQNRFGRVGSVNLALCAGFCVAALAASWPRAWRAVPALPALLLAVDPALHYYLAPPPLGALPGIQEAGVFLRKSTPAPIAGHRAGVLVPWDEAHYVVRYGERPVTATGFGPYIAPQTAEEVASLWTDREARLLRFAEQRDLGFVALSAATFLAMNVHGSGPFVAAPGGGPQWNWDYVKRVPLSVLMFAGSGVADLGVPHASRLLPRFASVAAPSAALQFLPDAWVYEIVAGARVRGRAGPRERVRLHTRVRVRGRTLVHEAWTEADKDGAFEIITGLPTGYSGANLTTAPEARLIRAKVAVQSLRVAMEAVRSGLPIDAAIAAQH